VPTKAKVAEACFRENLQLVAPNPAVNMEKWNLYNGLANLADAINNGNAQAADVASKCFSENWKGCDAQSQTEAWNLYNGLSNLADAVRDGLMRTP
jgi:hypothetical protein